MHDRPCSALVADAVRSGAAVRYGLPVLVPIDRTCTAHLDLAAARRGSGDPWVLVMRPVPGIAVLASDCAIAAHVADRACSPVDAGMVAAAVAASQLGDAERHSLRGDAGRRAAGAILLRVRDAHVRAAALTALDAWAAALGDRIEETFEGRRRGHTVARCPVSLDRPRVRPPRPGHMRVGPRGAHVAHGPI